MGWTRVRFEGTDAPGGLGKAAAREPTITAAMRARASGRAVYSLAFNFDTTLLAVTSDKRVDFLPNIPTAQEFLPNFNVVNWLGIFAPAQTPTPIIAKINAAIINAIARPDVRQKIEAAAIIPSTMESPATFQAFVDTEYSRWGEVLKQAKVELTD